MRNRPTVIPPRSRCNLGLRAGLPDSCLRFQQCERGIVRHDRRVFVSAFNRLHKQNDHSRRNDQYDAEQHTEDDREQFAETRYLRSESLDALLYRGMGGDDLLEETTVRTGDTECAHLLINGRVSRALIAPLVTALIS